jgi:hypothetical protein
MTTVPKYNNGRWTTSVSIGVALHSRGYCFLLRVRSGGVFYL